ncbi:estrogen receptor binding [Mactra antiquata]
MNVMDDTLANESGIPFLANGEDIPVHSTPIKGEKIPLPSTKNAMKHYLGQPGQSHDYSEYDSLMPIRYSDVHERVKKDQGFSRQEYVRKSYPEGKNYEFLSSRKSTDQNAQDLSNLDNLRPKMREHPPEKAFHHERSESPRLFQRSWSPKPFPRSGSPKPYQQSNDHERNNLSENPFTTGEKYGSKESRLFEKNDYSRRPLDSFKTSRSYYSQGQKDVHFVSSYNSNKRYDAMDKEGNIEGKTTKYEPYSQTANDRSSTSKPYTKYSSELSVQTSDGIGKLRNVDDKFDSKHEKPDSHVNAHDNETIESTNTKVGKSENSKHDKKRLTINSPSIEASGINKSSKQNTSLSELENTTLHKQRHEIQLLMTELKDRDKELSDMMTSHQQQLVAWQQDRDRLGMLERKCTQYEDELRAKTNQLRKTITDLKSLKSTEIEHQRELKNLKSTVEALNCENNNLKDEVKQSQSKSESLQETMTGLSCKIGQLEAREQELTTSLKLKEKDMSSAREHMKELSDRLQQLDLRCKECMDREKETIKDKEEWKKKYEQSREDYHTLNGELERKRKDVIKLCEDNESARQQLALLGKEAAMMERCKDELIDSMRVKQERTNTQLQCLREMYDRQVKEISSLQIQLDKSKELIYRQQNNVDNQQMSGSYQARVSQASDYSFEQSTTSQNNSWQRHKSSPISTKTKDSHHQTQSSGYQSQLDDNQPGNQFTASSDKGISKLTGSQNQKMNSGYHLHAYDNTSNAQTGTQPGSSYETSKTLSNGPQQRHTSELQMHEKFRNQSEKSTLSPQCSNSANKSKPSEPQNQTKKTYSPSLLRGNLSYKEKPQIVFDEKEGYKLTISESDTNDYSKQSTNVADESSFHTPPRLRQKTIFDSPERVNGFVKETAQNKLPENNAVNNKYENLRDVNLDLSEKNERVPNTFQSSQNLKINLTRSNKVEGQISNDTQCQISNPVQGQTLAQGQDFVQGQTLAQGQDFVQGRDHSEDNGAKYITEHELPQKAEKAANSSEKERNINFDDEFESHYAFENKLTSFLEGLDDIDDDIIWDDKPTRSFNLSVTESSPANKLRKLLIESQEMIHSLERSADSPRQNKARESTTNNDKQQITVDDKTVNS